MARRRPARRAIEETALNDSHQVAHRSADASILVAVSAQEGGAGALQPHFEGVEAVDGGNLGARRRDPDAKGAGARQGDRLVENHPGAIAVVIGGRQHPQAAIFQEGAHADRSPGETC